MKDVTVRVWSPSKKEMSVGMSMPMLAGYVMAIYPNLKDEVYLRGTGMMDKNHKQVFEGDVVKRTCLDESCELEHRGVVTYSDTWCMFGIDDPDQRESRKGYNAPLAWGNPSEKIVMGVEVLGNVYEHPDLR